MATVRTLGERPTKVYVLSELVSFNADGIAENLSDDVARKLGGIPGYALVGEAEQTGEYEHGEYEHGEDEQTGEVEAKAKPEAPKKPAPSGRRQAPKK